MKEVVASIVGLAVLILGLSWAAMGNEFFLYKVFAPRMEQVRRETFEQTKSYRQGTVQELENIQREYATATETQRSALRSIVLRRAADVPDDALPAHLRSFISELRREQ